MHRIRKYRGLNENNNSPRPKDHPNDLASVIRETWRELLRVDPEKEPEFAKAGGSSMDAIDLQLLLYKRTGRKILIESIPEPLTFSGVVDAVQSAEPVSEISSSYEVDFREAPATSSQIAQWIIEKANPGSCAYSVPILIRFSDAVCPTDLMSVLANIVQVHPALRTSIAQDNIKSKSEYSFSQIAHPPVQVFPLESSSVVSLHEEEIRTVLHEFLRTPPSIVRAAPFRAIALHLGDEIRGLLMLAHHAAVDDWSIRVLVEDVLKGLRNEPILPEKILLLDFEEPKSNKQDFAWWKQTLQDLPPNVSFPTPDPSLTDWPVVIRKFDAAVVHDLDHRCTSIGVEPATAIIHAVGNAVASVVDHTHSRISVGVPISIRSDPRLDRTVGMLLNTVPVPVELDRTDDVEALRSTRKNLREARRHKALPFDQIVREFGPRRVGGRTPWLDVMVGVVDRPATENELCKSEVLPPGESAAPLLVIARRATDRSICFEIQHDPSVVDHAVAVKIADAIIDELSLIVTGDATPIHSSEALGGNVPIPETLVDVVERVSRECPHAIAVKSDEMSLTFDELRNGGHRIAGALLERNITPGDVVAIDLEPGPAFPLAVFGVLRAGCVVMPLAPDLPDARRIQLLEAGNASIVLDEDLIAEAMEIPAPTSMPETSLESGCYLLFTSGSTGEPKGVLMQHGPISNLVAYEALRSRHAERTAMLAPLGFDVVFQEIFSTWASGGTIIPVPQIVRRDPFALADFLAKNQITRIHISPVLLRALAYATDSGATTLPDLQEVIAAGEALKVNNSLRNMAKSAGGFLLVNQYGPTETHVATSKELGSIPEQWPDLPSIGHPIDGVEVRVIDSDGNSVARGYPGELVIGGRGPNSEYLAEDIEDRFHIEDEQRWYRTGDRVRMKSSGDIEFLGREDDQVKVSGHRVELGEVEHALSRIHGVQDVAVAANHGEQDTTLHAFVVEHQSGSVDLKLLEESIRGTLPAFMVPRTIHLCDELPLSANGKVSRSQLLAQIVQDVSKESSLDSQDELEISSIVSAVIGVSSLPQDSSLGKLGLDSLGSIRLQFEFDQRYGIRISVQKILQSTISDLKVMIGDAVDSSKRSNKEQESKASKQVTQSLNPLEIDLLTEVAAAPDGAFHLAWKIEFDETIDLENLQKALTHLRESYPSLRTAQSVADGVWILDAKNLPSPRIEVLDEAPGKETQLALLRHSLDIERGECMRAVTWNQAGKTIVCMVIHHASIDGRGGNRVISKFISDVSSIQKGFQLQSAHESNSGITFVEKAEDVSWWTEQIEKVLTDGLPIIPRRHGADAEAHWSRVGDDQHLVEAAHRCAKRVPIPPMAPIIAAWAVMVSRLVERKQVLIGVPFAIDTESTNSFGLGTSGLPIAVDASDDRLVNDVVSEVAQVLALGLDRRGASLGSIARAFTGNTVLSRPPLDAVFTIDVGQQFIHGAHVSWEPIGISPFQAALILESNADQNDLVTQVESGLLDGEDVASFSERFYALLRAVIVSLEANDDESMRIEDLPRLTSKQEARLDAFENGGQCSNLGSSIPERFLESASKFPDSPAIITEHEVIDYQTLERWSSALADDLIQAGVQSGDRVGFFAPRCAESIVTMLGICRSGAVFVPIDPKTPMERRQQQLDIAEVKTVVAIRPEFKSEIPVVDRIIELPDRSRRPSNPSALKEREASTGLDSGIYVMFTSGTSGDPKGSLVLHRGVLRIASGQPFIRTDGPLRMLNAAPLAFDASTLEIWCPLLTGGLISCWEGRGADLVGIAERVRRDKVNAAWLTSALFQAAVDGVPTFFESLQIVNTGGDVVSAEHVRRIQSRYSDLVVVNGYGPTENTVFTTTEVIGPGTLEGKSSISIGRPVYGTTVSILDPNGHRLPMGKLGELVTGGDGVAQGYVGIDDNERFFAGEDGQRYYRTGDLARWSIDGRLEFYGRRDGQVKIGGNRVEFGAIEAALRMCPGVADACVSSIGDGARRKLIAAIAGDDSSISEATVRKWLVHKLSAAEVPAVIVAVPVIPVTKNGKPDRRAVAELVEGAPETIAQVKGDEELVTIVMDVVREALGRIPSSPTQKLVDAGIDSLDMVRITLALGDRLARPVQLGDVIQGGDVAGIAAQMRSEISREAEDVVVLRGSSNPDKSALYCIPGVGGTVFSYGSLLNSIDSDIPVIGLPYPGLSGGETPLDTVEDLADRFASLITKNRQAQTIVGYSLGGFVAFETARRVQEITGIAPMVVVIDSALAALHSWTGIRKRRSIQRDIRIRLESVLPPAVVKLLRGKKNVATLASLRSVVAAGFRAVRAYNPEPASLEILLLRTTQTKFDGAEELEDLGWGQVAAKLRVEKIEGRHLEVFRGSTGMDIALAITQEYNRAGRIVAQRRKAFRSSRG